MYIINMMNQIENYKYDEYDEMLHSLKELYKNLNFNDSLEIFMAYNYMLWNGYFSVNKEYGFNNERKILEDNYGVLTVTGSGTCVENSYMLKDVYKILGYDAIIIHNKINKLKINEELIKRKIIKNSINNNNYNHLSVLVKDNKYDYIYDPTNISCFNMISPKKAKLINGSGNMKLDINWYFYSEVEKIHLDYILEQIDYKKGSNKKEILYKMKLLIEKCNNHIEELNEFYLENKDNMIKLVKKLK